jgi:hypothetical protein
LSHGACDFGLQNIIGNLGQHLPGPHSVALLDPELAEVPLYFRKHFDSGVGADIAGSQELLANRPPLHRHGTNRDWSLSAGL